MIKGLEWNKKTAAVFAVAVALTIVLVVALNPREITIAENTTLDPVEWTFQRPDANQHVIIEDRLSARARYKRNNWQPRQLHRERSRSG
jgi:hypothetical protein